MDSLKDYQHHRLDLADVIRAALNIARASHDALLEGEARSLLARLAGDRITLAVVGQFSRGKSTLMNAILGADYLPTGELPMTSVITTVRYGSRERATFLRRGSTTAIEVPLASVPELIAQSGELRTELQVRSVDIELPAELLRLGVAIVDTPGLGSTIGTNEAATRQFLPDADAVVFVTGFDSALTEAEGELLRDVGAQQTKLFCVINKRDLVDEHAANQVVEAVHNRLEHYGFGAPRVFELSALQGLEAKLASDDGLLATSGLPALEIALEKFLTTEKSVLVLRNVAARASAMVRRQHRNLRLGQPGGDTPKCAAVVAQAFDERLAELRTEQDRLVLQIRDRIKNALPQRLASCGPGWRADLRAGLLPTVEMVMANRGKSDHSDPSRNSLQEEFETASEQVVTEWLRRCSTLMTDLLIDMVPDAIGGLFVLARSIEAEGARIAGVPLPEDDTVNSGWVRADLPTVATPRSAWSAPIHQFDIAHLRSAARAEERKRRLCDALEHAIVVVDEQLRSELLKLSFRWADDIEDQINKQIRDHATRFRRYLMTPPDPDDLSALQDVSTRLDAFRARVDTVEPSPGIVSGTMVGAMVGQPSHGASQAPDCVICVKLRETLAQYLRHSQYLLATRERDQKVHAATHGYCALHTWTYFTSGSPLGIAAGSAALAEEVAQTLETASAQAQNMRDLANSVDQLVVQRDTCPVCLVLAQAENAAIAELARAANNETDEAALCVGHTALLCAAESSPDRARSAVLRLAARLRRASEDMRSYALKREALSRSLITDEEAEAYRVGLRLLAGDPALARPSSGNKDLEFPSKENYAPQGPTPRTRGALRGSKSFLD